MHSRLHQIKTLRITLFLLTVLVGCVLTASTASAQCGHSGWPCCPDVHLGSIDDCCATEFGICIPFSCAYVKCTCNAGHTNIAGLCVPCGSEYAPACKGKCCQWFGSICINSCPCDPGLKEIGGICLDPNNPINCALNPCQPGCSPECNPLCPDHFDACSCAEYGEFCCVFDPCNSQCAPQCNPICPQHNLCDCLGIGCGCSAAGSCCSANGTAGCSDATCCASVCLALPHCCNQDDGWDQECANLAKDICFTCNPCFANPCAPGCGGACNPLGSCYDPCACSPCHPNCLDLCKCLGEHSCNPFCTDIFDPCACFGQDCPCGGEGEAPCPCLDPPFLCCDDGLGVDPAFGPNCTECYFGNPPYTCNNDGRGQLGQPGWKQFSTEYLRSFFQRCDTGLVWNPTTEMCVNATRHSPDVAQFKNSWTSQALRLQRRLNDQLPITQGQRLVAHNSYNNAVDLAPLYQHSYSLSDQLDMGLRAIELDVHWPTLPGLIGSPFADVRLAHAKDHKLAHFGMSPWDRAYRHAIEEISLWVKNNPGEVIFIVLEIWTDNTSVNLTNQSHHLIPPLEDFLGPYLFRPTEFEQLGGDWKKIRPKDILALGKRVAVVTGGGQGMGAINSAIASQNAIINGPATEPSWSADGANSVNAFLDPEQGHTYGSSTSSITDDPAIFSSFTGDSSAILGCGPLGVEGCKEVFCENLNCALLGYVNPTCLACDLMCEHWCTTASLYDGPETFGLTTPSVVREMLRAGVNEIGLCPLGESIAGVIGSYEPHFMPFQPLMEAAVWSWWDGHPVVFGGHPSLTRGAILQFTGFDGDLPVGRFSTQLQSASHRVAALSPDGRAWALTQGTATFANAAALVEQEFPGWHFAVPGNALQMQRLTDAMIAAGSGAAWVNYHAPPTGLNWTGNVVPESLSHSAPVGCGALLFDGQTDHVDVGTVGNFGANLATATIEFWIRSDNTSKTMSAVKVIDDLPGFVDPVFGVELNRTWGGGVTCAAGGFHSGRTLFFLRDATGKMLTRSIDTDIYDGRWTHVAWVIENAKTNQTKVYIDGKPVTSFATQCNQGPSAFQPWTTPLALGAANNRGLIQAHLDGALDEVRLWNVARTEQEIKDNHKKVVDPATPGLVAYWRFDEGQGQVAFDHAGQSHGALIGPPAWLITGVCDPYTPPTTPGDLNGDGSVGVSDLLILLAAWGPCPNPAPAPGECPADLNGDANVGVADLLILLSNWG